MEALIQGLSWGLLGIIAGWIVCLAILCLIAMARLVLSWIRGEPFVRTVRRDHFFVLVMDAHEFKRRMRKDGLDVKGIHLPPEWAQEIKHLTPQQFFGGPVVW